MTRLNGRLAKLEAAVIAPPATWSAEEKTAWESAVDRGFYYAAGGPDDYESRGTYTAARYIWRQIYHRFPKHILGMNYYAYYPAKIRFDQALAAFLEVATESGATAEELKQLEVFDGFMSWVNDHMIEGYHSDNANGHFLQNSHIQETR